MAADWTDEQEDILAQEWRNYPCLYDTGSREFSNKNFREQAQKALGAATGHSGNDLGLHNEKA
jgi:hypothetical protein